MNRNRFLLTCSALAISFFAANAFADVVGSCTDITHIRYMLQKYASYDPTNFNIRTNALAESYPCMRDDVLRESSVIASKNGLANTVSTGPVSVAQPAPQQYVPYQPVQQIDTPPVLQTQTVDTVAGPVIAKTTPAAVSSSGLFSGTGLILGGVGLLVGGAAAAALITKDSRIDADPAFPFVTNEYRAQYSLTTMDAARSYGRGYAGAGIQIAVIDTGLDTSHPEFAGRVTPGEGFNFVGGFNGQPPIEYLNSHGTEVAGVLAANRDGLGMHGVAFEASIVPLRVFTLNGNPIDDLSPAIRYARNKTQARIINGSYGPDDAWHTTYEALGYQGIITVPEISEANAYRAFVNAGGILVFAAGNSFQAAPNIASNPTGPGFLPFIRPQNSAIVGAVNGAYRDENGNTLDTADYSSLQPNTIVVASVDQNNVISSFSNRCGVAAAWCMVAPGENIFTTTLGGGYTTVSGTSFAAPQVSGAIAILKQEFPNLTPAQIVSRLLNTATDLGDPGVDAIYGHGLLNLAAATNPIGITGISTTGLLTGNIIPMSSSTLSYGYAFGSSIVSAFNGVNVLILDSYGAAFTADLRGRISSTTSNFDAHKAVAKFDRPDDRQELSFGDRTHVGFV
ncbi:MAG: S8 family serine peptidase, partial [Alphaproteobacteria bacterium]|nr:S8 family serine peptidase [Alphaproteobacteria bacterium]